MKYLSNAFSLNMVAANLLSAVRFTPLTLEQAQEISAEHQSCVGHADTAEVIASVLGHEVEFNRVSVSLEKGDQLLVAQYKGPRLEEGATTLPTGAAIEWVLVTL